MRDVLSLVLLHVHVLVNEHAHEHDYVACRTMSGRACSGGQDPYGTRLYLGRCFNCTRHSLNDFRGSYESSRATHRRSATISCFTRISGLIGDWPPKWIHMVLMEICLLVKSHPEDDTRTISSLQAQKCDHSRRSQFYAT